MDFLHQFSHNFPNTNFKAAQHVKKGRGVEYNPLSKVWFISEINLVLITDIQSENLF